MIAKPYYAQCADTVQLKIHTTPRKHIGFGMGIMLVLTFTAGAASAIMFVPHQVRVRYVTVAAPQPHISRHDAEAVQQYETMRHWLATHYVDEHGAWHALPPNRHHPRTTARL